MTASSFSLAHYLARMIESEGPIAIPQFMQAALSHPKYGYYATRPAIGAEGDFITAPEISQLFGELVGIWVLQTWLEMGEPDNWQLIELGPGRGTLLSDIIRVLSLRPKAVESVEVHLVETSPVLRDAQEEVCKSLGIAAQWHKHISLVPKGISSVLVANEFFDALPIRQFVKTEGAWCERRVKLSAQTTDATPQFEFCAVPTPYPVEETCPQAKDASSGRVVERCADAEHIITHIAKRLAEAPGRALIVDYGYVHENHGDTLQALKAHEKVDPLTDIGSADLTAHVDFAGLARHAQTAGARAFAVLTQGEFLTTLGIDIRRAALAENAPPEARAQLDRAVARLTAPDQMGTLFKVLALSSAGLPPPPPFVAEFAE